MLEVLQKKKLEVLVSKMFLQLKEMLDNLKELILQNFKPSEGKLIYISGEIISSDLDKELISSGYTIERLINYRANAIEKYDESFIEKLKIENA